VDYLFFPPSPPPISRRRKCCPCRRSPPTRIRNEASDSIEESSSASPFLPLLSLPIAAKEGKTSATVPFPEIETEKGRSRLLHSPTLAPFSIPSTHTAFPLTPSQQRKKRGFFLPAKQLILDIFVFFFPLSMSNSRRLIETQTEGAGLPPRWHRHRSAFLILRKLTAGFAFPPPPPH